MRPHGHSFEAVRILQENLSEQEKFSVFDFDDGSHNGRPSVIKSCATKVISS